MTSSHEPTLNLPNPWAAVGRDTEAGRALFALYNGYGQARNRGNEYSQFNKIKTLKHIATHGVPEFPVLKPPPPKKAEVKVPASLTGDTALMNSTPVDFIPRRRRASNILQKIRDDSYIVELPPMPKGPLLDEAEKARLQEVFYWSNRNLGPDPPVAEPVRRLPRKGSIEEQELLLNTIASEIEDREAFQTEMEDYGKGEQYRSQIMFEIQQRVGQMKLLHENITEQEKKENEKQTLREKPSCQDSYPTPPPLSYARGQGRNANTTLRFNITSLPKSDKDPRFERSSAIGPFPTPPRPNPTSSYISSQPGTPDSSTPNVIRTASCYATTPDKATPSTVNRAEPKFPPTPPQLAIKFPAASPKKMKLNSRLSSAGDSSAIHTGSPNGPTARASLSCSNDLRNRENLREESGDSGNMTGVKSNANAPSRDYNSDHGD